jgi:DNA-binding NarL/FixJ family response regulator
MMEAQSAMSRKRSVRAVGGRRVERRSAAGQELLAFPDDDVEKLRLGVAAQPALFCEVLACHLSRERGFHVVGQVSGEDEIVRLLKTEKPQVLIFDYEGLGPNAESVISRMHRVAPATRILVLATRSSQETVVRVLRVGASGLVGKQLQFATLVRAIHALAKGELWANRRATADLVEHLAEGSGLVVAPDGELTAREMEIIDDVGRGLRNKDIARRLDISEKTVKSHLNNIFRKLRVNNRFAAGMYAVTRSQLSG